jgi:hypothetical protein
MAAVSCEPPMHTTRGAAVASRHQLYLSECLAAPPVTVDQNMSLPHQQKLSPRTSRHPEVPQISMPHTSCHV